MPAGRGRRCSARPHTKQATIRRFYGGDKAAIACYGVGARDIIWAGPSCGLFVPYSVYQLSIVPILFKESRILNIAKRYRDLYDFLINHWVLKAVVILGKPGTLTYWRGNHLKVVLPSHTL